MQMSKPQTEKGIWYDPHCGSLHIDYPSSCATRIKISSWEDGLEVYRYSPEFNIWVKEENVDPGIPLPLSQRSVADSTPFERYMQNVPDGVKEVLAPFFWRQFVLLRMMRQDTKVTLDLLHSNSALAFLLVCRGYDQGLSTEELVKLAGKKRKEILAFSGGLCCNSAVNILSKIRASNEKPIHEDEQTRRNCYLSQKTADQLLATVNDKKIMENLRHCAAIPLIALTSLKDRQMRSLQMLAFKDYEEKIMMKENTFREVITWESVWSDTVGLGNSLRVQNPVRVLSKCGSLENLLKMHDKWSVKLASRRRVELIDEMVEKYATSEFPKPPLEGEGAVEHISNMEQLVDEARYMKHCALSYVEKIMNRDCYLYSVRGPERATLEVALINGNPVMVQLRGVKNASVSEGVKDIVTCWFNRDR